MSTPAAHLPISLGGDGTNTRLGAGRGHATQDPFASKEDEAGIVQGRNSSRPRPSWASDVSLQITDNSLGCQATKKSSILADSIVAKMHDSVSPLCCHSAGAGSASGASIHSTDLSIRIRYRTALHVSTWPPAVHKSFFRSSGYASTSPWPRFNQNGMSDLRS